jgi:nucleoside-diphosphate-sugar epimerase
MQLTIGSARNHLPYTYVGNAVDCLLLSAICPAAVGEAYNVVDEPQVTAREMTRECLKVTGEDSILTPVPRFLLDGAAKFLEGKSAKGSTGSPPKLSRYVIASACRDLRYDTRKAREQLGWRSFVSLEEGLRKTFDPVPNGRR